MGASGDQTRRRAQEAAAGYAALTRKLGLSDAEALSIVRAALDEGKGRP